MSLLKFAPPLPSEYSTSQMPHIEMAVQNVLPGAQAPQPKYVSGRYMYTWRTLMSPSFTAFF